MDIASASSAIKALLREEYKAQQEQPLLLAPIFLAFGIGFYFLLPSEPPLVLGLISLLIVFSCKVLLGAKNNLLLFGALLLSLGFFAAQLRTHIIYTPILEKDLGPVEIIGEIIAIEDLGDEAGSRLIVSDLKIEGLSQTRTPQKVRLKLWKDKGLRVGQRIQALAKLHPPSPPVMPGGFDFQRYLFFQSIGAVGFIFNEPQILNYPLPSIVFQKTEAMRQAIARSVEAHVPYPQASIMMALMIGRKTAIDSDDQDAMRHAGLAHMLAISGLHIGLFSGVLFFSLRFILSLVPVLALHYPIKKYAAVFAILGSVFYMFLAGATIPTVRAVIMTGIAFVAIILDRSPISLRLVAFAAFMVLLLFPESLLSASFHLSFAAVTALIVFYNWLRPYWSVWRRNAGLIKRFALYFLAIIMTTMIATLATAPFALFHFHQLASYSLLGNILAMPVLAFYVMPGIVLSFISMVFGLSAFIMSLVGYGALAVLDIAHWVSSLPYAVFKVPMWPYVSLVFLVLSVLFFILGYRFMRMVAGGFLILSIFYIIQFNQYDVLISSQNKLVAIISDSDQMYVSDLRKERFARAQWMESYALDKRALIKWPKEGRIVWDQDSMLCDQYACRIDFKGHQISYLYDRSVQKRECDDVDVIIAPFPVDQCRAPVQIDLFESLGGASHGIRIQGPNSGDIHVYNSVDMRGYRPWSKGNDRF